MKREPERPGLYLHLPFCRSICPYCDFYVLTDDPARRQQFVADLLAEIELCAESPWPGFVEPAPVDAFDTIYLGGGTPSRFSPEDLASIGAAVADRLVVAGEPWVGLEANPEDITAESLTVWRQIGVRFVSLGIQSFDARALTFLGRRHSPRDGHTSVLRARDAGFETLSIDLIFGLPDQTADDWRRDLEHAVSLAPDHLSCYQLTIEPGTPFGFRHQRGRFVPLAADRQADLFLFTHLWLAEHGFEAYEVSNFATTPSHRSRHNLKYWHHTPYLGLGPSAHSHAARQRWWNHRKIKPWQRAISAEKRPIGDHETLTAGQIHLESLMLGLRTPAGIDFDSLLDGAGTRLWEANEALIDELCNDELVAVDGRRVMPTLAGLATAEALARRFTLVEP